MAYSRSNIGSQNYAIFIPEPEMPFNQNGSNDSTNFQGNYNDVQGDQDNRFIGTIVHGQNQTYHANTIIFNVIAEQSAQQTSQAVAGSSNVAPSVAAQCPLQSWQRKVIAAANDMSGLIASIIRHLENRTEYFDSYRDLKLSLELLYRAMIMSRFAALEILGPRGRNLASTTKQAILECRETLQELFFKLEGHQDLRVTGILRNHAPRRFQRQELCRIKKGLQTHLVTITESLALTEYVRYSYE